MTEDAPHIEFEVAPWRTARSSIHGEHVLLVPRRWDDYGFRTLFAAFLVGEDGTQRPLGEVKILQRGSKKTILLPTFEQLPEEFCSLGKTAAFYEAIVALGEPRCTAILRGLRDIALSPDIEQAFAGEPGLHRSLMRLRSAKEALRAGRQLLGLSVPHDQGAAFSFRIHLEGFDDPHEVDFSFSEDKATLGRMNVLVGKNGTGKTRFLAGLAHALSGVELERGELDPNTLALGPVLAVSYSAFDTFTRPDWGRKGLEASYHYCGLRDKHGAIDLDAAYRTFEEALRTIERKNRRMTWTWLLRSSGLLDTEIHLEPFVDAAPALAAQEDDQLALPRFDEEDDEIRRTFAENIEPLLDEIKRLSAGHKLTLFVLTNLLAAVEKKAIILFDEPELHLHPNMLSALLRSLHIILDAFSAYAILATHSPIVVQEIPSAYVRILGREGGIPFTRAYPRESFGASLDEIVRIAFQSDEQQRNYVRLLEGLAKRLSPNEIAALLDEDLPLGVRLLLTSMSQGRTDEED